MKVIKATQLKMGEVLLKIRRKEIIGSQNGQVHES